MQLSPYLPVWLVLHLRFIFREVEGLQGEGGDGEGRRTNRINPLNSLQRKLGAPPAVLLNKWSMLLFNSIKQNYKSQRWLINLNRLLCMKLFFLTVSWKRL